jgi:hypothetical protein
MPDRPVASEIPAPPPLPRESRRWYFAEGSTQQPFDVDFALQNPNPVPTVAHFLFVSPIGQQTPYDQLLAPNSRTTVQANNVLPNAEFATIVTTELPVYVERSMYFGHDGHSAAGARQWQDGIAEGLDRTPVRGRGSCCSIRTPRRPSRTCALCVRTAAWSGSPSCCGAWGGARST